MEWMVLGMGTSFFTHWVSRLVSARQECSVALSD